MSYQMSYDPVSMRWSLSDGSHYLELPEWAREVLTWVHERETKQLKTENAKLRELVNLMAVEFSDMSNCSETPCSACPVSTECDREQQLMRELGIEVS